MALFKPFRGTRATLDSQELHDGYAYFCTDDGSFHIDYVDSDGNLQRKQINAEEAEKLTGYTIATSLLYASDTRIPTAKAVQNSLNTLQRKIVHADLATNDDSKHSYVKNRTHWIEYEKGEELVSFSFNAETSYVNGYRALSYDEDAEAAITLLKTLLVEGTMYIVVHNNIEYECVVSHGFMSDEIYLGNMWISSSAKEDTEEQFLIRPNENGYDHFVSIGAGIQSIAIYAANEIIHPLDEKFLPEAIAYTSDVDEIKALVGDTSVSEQINTALNSHVVSWNDLNDKPFETVYAYNISSDGNEEGLLSYMGFYKVSDLVPSIEDFANGFIFKAAHDSVEQFYTKDDVSVGDMFWGASAIKFKEGPYFAVVQEDATSSNGQTTLTKGVYFMSTMGFAHTLKIGGVDIIHDECISDAIARVGDIPEQTQSDWNQTDETATDYVKNRPCGRYAAKEVYSGTVTGFTSLSYATTPTWSAIVPTGVGIPEYGQVYDVTIDGITYRGTAVQETTFAEPAIGTTEVYYYPNEQHPYTIIFRENEFEVHVQIEGDSHTIEFNRVDSIKKLSMVFLPDELITEGELKKARSNWAQNDSTALDYIHNRTHYDAEVSNVIADEQEVTYTYDSSLNYSTPTSHGKVTTVSDIRLVVGNQYVVTIDGQEYTATAQSGTDSMESNCPFLFVDFDTVICFFIHELRDHESYGCIAVEVYNAIQRTNMTHSFTIKIEEKSLQTVPLDEKYIPSTIARVSEIAEHTTNTSNPHNVTAEQVGIYIGSDEPTDENIKVWINTSEEGTGVIPLLPRITTITLVEANWVGNSAPYSQVVEIPSATAVSKIDLQPTVSQIIELQNADIAFMAENLDGVITVYSFGGKPSANMTMQVMLTEVSYV